MKRRARRAATLPEELVLEILARVADVPALFRFATACKRWRRLIADPFFLSHSWLKCAHHPPSSVLGFFVTRPFYQEKEIGRARAHARPVLAPAFVPLPRLGISFGRRFTVSFPSGTAGLMDRVVAITSRGGLLLVRLDQRERGDPYQSVVRLAVCDPVAGTCDVLPPLISHGIYGVENYAILTDADFCSSGQRRWPFPGYSTFFKVIAIVVKRGLFKLYTFSSSEPSWSTTYQRFEQAERRRLVTYWPNDAAVCHGTPHWLIGGRADHYYTLSVSVETGHALLTRISIAANHFDFRVHDFPHLSVTSGGALSLIWLHRDGRWLETWTRQDDRGSKDDGAGWLPSLIKLNLPERRQINQAASYVLLAEMNGVLLIRDNAKRLYFVDINTGAPMEEVTDSFRGLGCSEKVVPFKLDLSAFFISRLRSGSS